MNVHIERPEQELSIAFSGKATLLLKKLKINPTTVVIVRNGTLVAEDTELKNSDTVDILAVVSGG